MKSLYISRFTAILIVIIIFGAIPLFSQSFTIPEIPFSDLQGSYNVGTKEFLWIDSNRKDDLTPDQNDNVHVMVQVWYPTNDESKTRQPYITNPKEFGANTRYNNLHHVKTNSIVNASLSNRHTKYPVLIYSHGSGMSRFTNTFQAEYLASQGYIIFGIDHPSNNHTTLYPDGVDTSDRIDWFKFESMGDPYLNAIKEREVYDRGIVQYWAKDATFVINTIERISKEESNFFYEKIDMENLGMYGYSLGGILTLQMCAQDQRIKAGLSSDGSILGYVWKTGVTQPFLFIKPEKTLYSQEKVESDGRDYQAYLFTQGVDQLRAEFLHKNSDNEMYFLTIPNTKHNNFNDMALFEPQDDNLIDVQLAHEIVNDYSLSFFNKYLKNRDDKLFDSYPGKYKEAKLRKK